MSNEIEKLESDAQAAQWEIDGLREDIDFAERELDRMKWALNDAVRKRNDAVKALRALGVEWDGGGE